MLRLVALSARCRLLRVGAAAISARRAPCLDIVGGPPSSAPGHVETSRFFSSQKKDGGNDSTNGPRTKLALYDPAAWREAVKPALLTFLKIEKHLMVPVAFTVPYGDAAWTRAAWGYPLGKHAAWLRKQWRGGGDKIDPEQLNELNEMPFAWDWSQYKWDHFVLPALRRFFELNGQTDMSLAFRVPNGDPQWPEHLWGLRLGNKVGKIRARSDFPLQIEKDSKELERLKFCHDSTVYDRDWREKLIPALKAFRQQFGHCNVSIHFTVPATPPWPEAAWNMRLGDRVQSVRAGQVGADRYHQELEELGFAWNHIEWEWSKRILPALYVFHRVNGHCRVPSRFTVPSNETWPKQAWGLKLGSVVSDIRSADEYSVQVTRDKPQLKALGFVWDFFEFEWSERVLPAWQVFYEEHGHSQVPISFVVPFEAPWPIEAHGLKLGHAVSSVRHRGNYFDYSVRSMDSLEAIEFELKIPASKWTERVEPLLATFEQLHGNRNVPDEFVVPSCAPWREKDWGIPLGRLQMR